MAAHTLEEALALGRGVERPFRCHVHDDTNASASVNVIKNVWVCYACRASGTSEDARAPAVSDLLAMVEPEKGVRLYPEAWLELFTIPVDGLEGSEWGSRFPGWLVWHEKLGEDPFTNHATYPVRTPSGRLAGVAHRVSDSDIEAAKAADTNPSRYRYPYKWSASRTLHGWPSTHRGGVVVLGEGAADKIALTEIGVPAFATYGAGLHMPQTDLLLRTAPDLVLLGFDMDDAGEQASRLTRDLLADKVPTVRVKWPRKDPADCPPDERREAIREAVGASVYDQLRPQWDRRVETLRREHETELETQ